MSDTKVEQGASPAVAEAETKVLTIDLRAKCGTVEVDTNLITDDGVFAYVVKMGLEAIINKVGMSKIAAGITKLSGEAHTKAVAEVKAQAEKTIASLYDGSIKMGKGTAKVSGAVNTEAMRLAKVITKQTLRDNGYKVSAFDAKEITSMAKTILAANPNLYKQAEENLKAREAEGKGVKGFDLAKLLGDKVNSVEHKAKPKVPPKPKAKGEKPQLSAAQASKVAPRQKPAGVTAH